MPVAEIALLPEVNHHHLETTFCGIVHPASTPENPIHQYLGIKYASFPARFRQSHVFTQYPPIVDCSQHGPICPQPKSTHTVEEVLFGIAAEDIPKQFLRHDEFECLNLNITCPGDLTLQSRVPVMLWFHGGTDRGSGSNWIYDGGSIVRKSMMIGKPIILVTFNFRLGLFGFAAGPTLREDNKLHNEEGVGNYGLRDQRNVMKWIHRYISDFGGDPSNVTLFGESSGAADIVSHLLSRANQTQPLFHRVIVQSAVIDATIPDIPSAGSHISRVSAMLGVACIDQLRALEADKLLPFGNSMRAVDDGSFFVDNWKEFFEVESSHTRSHAKESIIRATRSSSVARGVRSTSIARSISRPASISRPSSIARPASLLRPSSKARSRSALRSHYPPTVREPVPLQQMQFPPGHQPIIIGDALCDSLVWSLPISLWSAAAVVRRIKAICQSLIKTNSLLRAYDITPHTPDDELYERVLELVNDARIAWPTECVASSAKRGRGDKGVWRYVFDQEGPARGVPHHAADLIYLFDNVPLPKSCYESAEPEVFCDGPFGDLSDDEDEDAECATKYQSVVREDSGNGEVEDEEGWRIPVVDEWTYARVRDTMQERWIAFACGEVPWREDKVFVFGPEGETGERSAGIFEGRRRRQIWKQVLEPLGLPLIQKLGVELSRGPPLSSDCSRF